MADQLNLAVLRIANGTNACCEVKRDKGGEAFAKIDDAVYENNIPDVIILNWDQTGVNMLPIGQ
ncbi:LOW QUALITY PROTEIN: hypothetical protein MAR_007666 [Mya arenaria]|uniref:Uncharacterized protein n=1 Tax=Mya arenaria TaxID=6604 RepID=A0ABY7DTP1_MYAAR|nr:LOW QUALITY PROTEIN: hypothetical protein MAR_007666 [Mya arenaria]